MRILLVDDEELQLLRLKDTVIKVLSQDNEYLIYSNPVKAYEENKDKVIDIAFLDIEMPVMNGIQLAKKLKIANPQVNIIFVTAYDGYALEAHKMHASGYITKPVNETLVRNEIEGLRYPVALPEKEGNLLEVKCFGNFEVFKDGEPLRFARSKSKELFAYLIDREGAAVSLNELNAILWDEDKSSYLRNLIVDIQTTLKEVGAEDVFVKRHSECFVNVDKINCDAYEYKKNNPTAIRMYRGEYMAQYSWPIFKNDWFFGILRGIDPFKCCSFVAYERVPLKWYFFYITISTRYLGVIMKINARSNRHIVLLVVLVSVFVALSILALNAIQVQDEVYADGNEANLVANEMEQNVSQVNYVAVYQGVESWAVSIIVSASILVILIITYLIMFFALNKYIVEDGKVVRAFRVSTHEGQIHLLTYKFSMVYRIPEEVYETKQKAKEINN